MTRSIISDLYTGNIIRVKLMTINVFNGTEQENPGGIITNCYGYNLTTNFCQHGSQRL